MLFTLGAVDFHQSWALDIWDSFKDKKLSPVSLCQNSILTPREKSYFYFIRVDAGSNWKAKNVACPAYIFKHLGSAYLDSCILIFKDEKWIFFGVQMEFWLTNNSSNMTVSDCRDSWTHMPSSGILSHAYVHHVLVSIFLQHNEVASFVCEITQYEHRRRFVI